MVHKREGGAASQVLLVDVVRLSAQAAGIAWRRPLTTFGLTRFAAVPAREPSRDGPSASGPADSLRSPSSGASSPASSSTLI
jgi:hypothetical protein